jgi:hypothetical protein
VKAQTAHPLNVFPATAVSLVLWVKDSAKSMSTTPTALSPNLDGSTTNRASLRSMFYLVTQLGDQIDVRYQSV